MIRCRSESPAIIEITPLKITRYNPFSTQTLNSLRVASLWRNHNVCVIITIALLLRVLTDSILIMSSQIGQCLIFSDQVNALETFISSRSWVT